MKRMENEEDEESSGSEVRTSSQMRPLNWCRRH